MKLTQEDIENLNRPITNKESVLVIKKLSTENPRLRWFPHSSFTTSVTDNKTKKDLPIQKFATIYLMNYKVNYKINETLST